MQQSKPSALNCLVRYYIFLEIRMSLKLYKVTCKGMMISSTGVTHGISYVLAEDLKEAYETVRINLDKRDLGFDKDRELDRIELLAENVDCPDCGTRVYA